MKKHAQFMEKSSLFIAITSVVEGEFLKKFEKYKYWKIVRILANTKRFLRFCKTTFCLRVNGGLNLDELKHSVRSHRNRLRWSYFHERWTKRLDMHFYLRSFYSVSFWISVLLKYKIFTYSQKRFYCKKR